MYIRMSSLVYYDIGAANERICRYLQLLGVGAVSQLDVSMRTFRQSGSSSGSDRKSS